MTHLLTKAVELREPKQTLFGEILKHDVVGVEIDAGAEIDAAGRIKFYKATERLFVPNWRVVQIDDPTA